MGASYVMKSQTDLTCTVLVTTVDVVHSVRGLEYGVLSVEEAVLLLPTPLPLFSEIERSEICFPHLVCLTLTVPVKS